MGRPKNVARERSAAHAAALLIRVVALSRPRNLLWGFYSKDSARTGRQVRVRDADEVTMAGILGLPRSAMDPGTARIQWKKALRTQQQGAPPSGRRSRPRLWTGMVQFHEESIGSSAGRSAWRVSNSAAESHSTMCIKPCGRAGNGARRLGVVRCSTGRRQRQGFRNSAAVGGSEPARPRDGDERGSRNNGS